MPRPTPTATASVAPVVDTSPPPTYVLAEDVERFDEDGKVLTETGLRVERVDGSYRVATQGPAKGTLTWASALPASMGGGYVFATRGAVYRASTFLGELKPLTKAASGSTRVGLGPGYLWLHVSADASAETGVSLPDGTPLAEPPLAELRQVERRADGSYLAVLRDGTRRVSIDEGASWKVTNDEPTKRSWPRARQRPRDPLAPHVVGQHALRATAEGVLMQSADGGETWHAVAPPPGPRGPLTIYACDEDGCDIGDWRRVGWPDDPAGEPRPIPTRAPEPVVAPHRISPLMLVCSLDGPATKNEAELLPERHDDRNTPITVGSSRSLRGAWLNTHRDVQFDPPSNAPELARAVFVNVFDPAGRLVTRTVSRKMLVDIQSGSHGRTMRWGVGGAVSAPVLSRFYAGSDGWTLSFDVAFVWIPSTRPTVNRWGSVANPENVTSAVSTRDGQVRGLATELTGDIVSTDQGHLARYLGTEVSALGVDAKRKLAAVRLPADGLPPSSTMPITLTPLGGEPSAAAPFGRLETDDSPACRQAREGFRAILSTKGWLQATVDDVTTPRNDELLLLRFEEDLLCLEAVEVVPPVSEEATLAVQDTPISLAPYLVARFSGSPAAAQLRPDRDGVSRRPAQCKLTTSPSR